MTAEQSVSQHAFARRLLTQLDDAGYTPAALDRLVQWVAWAHDTRWIELRVTVDGPTGAPVYAIEAHTLEPCRVRDGERVDHVYHGAARNIVDACAAALDAVGAG